MSLRIRPTRACSAPWNSSAIFASAQDRSGWASHSPCSLTIASLTSKQSRPACLTTTRRWDSGRERERRSNIAAACRASMLPRWPDFVRIKPAISSSVQPSRNAQSPAATRSGSVNSAAKSHQVRARLVTGTPCTTVRSCGGIPLRCVRISGLRARVIAAGLRPDCVVANSGTAGSCGNQRPCKAAADVPTTTVSTGFARRSAAHRSTNEGSVIRR